MELAAKAVDCRTRQALIAHYLQRNATRLGLPEVPQEEHSVDKMRRKVWYQLEDARNVYIKEGYGESNKDWSSYVPDFKFHTENKYDDL